MALAAAPAAFPTFSPDAFDPWAASALAPGDMRTPEELAGELAATRQKALLAHGIDEALLARFHQTTEVRVLTP